MSRPVVVGYDPRRPDWAPVYFGVEAARIAGTRLIVAAVEAGGPEPPMTAGQLDGGGAHARLALPRRRRPSDWDEGRPLRSIGAAYVDSEEARAALHGAHALAGRAGAKLRVISVVTHSPRMYLETETYVAGQFGKDLADVEGGQKLWTERHLREVVLELGDAVSIEIDVMVGDAAELLVEVSRHLDLLVMGARGYGPLRAVLLGSVSRRVTASARCPVIVLPRGAKAALEGLVADGQLSASA